MNSGSTVLMGALLWAGAASAQDAAQTDGDKYKVLLDNEHVRVLDYTDQPGQKTQVHRHPRFVLYALAPFKRSLTLTDGRVVSREFKAGDVMYSDGETHVGMNIGTSPTHVLIVELKDSRP